MLPVPAETADAAVELASIVAGARVLARSMVSFFADWQGDRR
jgi:hypothetical protein